MFTHMSTLTVIRHTPKVSNNSISRLPAKPWTDSKHEPVKTPPMSTKAVENNDWQQKPARDSEDTAPVIQGSAVNTDQTHGMCLDLLFC